jgi:DNA-binding transcriptional LysR family regulator
VLTRELKSDLRAAGVAEDALARVSRRYPKVTFQVTPLEPAAMGFRELRERRVDLTVGRIVHPPLDDDLDAEVLFEDRLRVVAGASSPWARRRKITMKELMHEPWLHIPEDNAVNAYVAAALRARGLALPTPIVSTYSMHVRYNLLATGRFLALLWNWTLHFNSNGGSVKALPVELGIPSRPVATAKLKNRTISPVVELFIEQARDVAKSMTKSRC